MGKRVDVEKRRVQLIDACMEIARLCCYKQVTRKEISKRCGCSQGTVYLILGSMDHVREMILLKAINEEDLLICAQGLTHNDPMCSEMKSELINKVSDFIRLSVVSASGANG